jgi:hypothetical protein
MPMSRAFVRVAALCACLTAGCATGDSLMEKGERVETGRGRFDSYFGEVADLRNKVKGIDSDLFPIRQPLTEEFSLGVDTPLQKIMEETRKRVEKLRTFGVVLGLRISPQPVVLVEAGELGQEEGDEGALKAIQEAAVRALATYRQYQELSQLATKLDDQRNELAASIEKLPPDFDKKSLIENEIVGAGRVLQEVQNKLLKDSRTCALFLVALAEAVDSGGIDAHEQACSEAKAHWKPPRRPPNKRGPGKRPAAGAVARPAAGPAAGPRPGPGPAAVAPPPPPPPPRPKAGGDFDM